MSTMDLKRWVSKVEDIIHQDKYTSLKKMWSEFYNRKKINFLPIKCTFTMAYFSKILNINLIDHYQNPMRYIEDSLRIISYQNARIPDDRVLSGVTITFGEVFEQSLFNIPPVFWNNQDPALSPDPLIKTEADLDSLEYPDFYESGLMPKVIEIYETAKKTLNGRIPVFFERWDRGPWGIAVSLRGAIELIKDTIRQPDFVHNLLNYITESRMRWEQEKEKFLGVKTTRGTLADDDVDAGIISPTIYQNFIFPYEKKLGEFYRDGIFYFHSCGNITPFLKHISMLRGLRRIHISPYTDFQKAVVNYGDKFVYQKRLDPINDVFNVSKKVIEKKIRNILNIAQDTNIEIDPGPIVAGSIDAIQDWIKLARKIGKSHYAHA